LVIEKREIVVVGKGEQNISGASESRRKAVPILR
jgi:hypothetical protein